MEQTARFVDLSGAAPREQQRWPSIVVPKATIEREIERLASIARPGDGRRASAFDHPRNTGPVPAFAPGIDVILQVLKPGEETSPVMRNSALVEICIGGKGTVHVGKKQFTTVKHDVWNVPSMEPIRYRNDGTELFVRLTYSNAPLLEKLEVHYVDTDPGEGVARGAPPAHGTSGQADDNAPKGRARDAAKPITIGTDGAQMLGYEWLVDIDTVESKSLHWPWAEVSPHLQNVYGMDVAYTGRHLYLLYNPATERRMGTSHSFFATIAKLPRDKVDQPHRHSSAAINYIMWGKGKSAVEGHKLQWEEGDLHFSAPGWAVHNHASRDDGFIALTIQDHPLQIAMESLLWQETLKSPILKLGSSQGVETNLAEHLKVA